MIKKYMLMAVTIVSVAMIGYAADPTEGKKKYLKSESLTLGACNTADASCVATIVCNYDCTDSTIPNSKCSPSTITVNVTGTCTYSAANNGYVCNATGSCSSNPA